MKISPPLLVALVILSLLNIVILIFCLLWCKTKRRDSKGKAGIISKSQLYTDAPNITTTLINHSENIKFEIPPSSPTKHQLQSDKSSVGSVDIFKYDTGTKRRLSKIPKLIFELSYDFYTSQLKVFLQSGENITKKKERLIIVSVFLTHLNDLYRTLPVIGPHPFFNEEFSFPVDTLRISEYPPVILKFNVWLIDTGLGHREYGTISVEVEQLLTQEAKGLTPENGESTVTRNIIRAKFLTGEDFQSQLLLSLFYEGMTNIIYLCAVELDQLILSSFPKEVYLTATLIDRGIEKHIRQSDSFEMSTKVPLNQKFVFSLSDIGVLCIDHVTLRVEVQSRYVNLKSLPKHCNSTKPFSHGCVLIGSSSVANQIGKEHWAEALISEVPIIKQYSLDGEFM